MAEARPDRDLPRARSTASASTRPSARRRSRTRSQRRGRRGDRGGQGVAAAAGRVHREGCLGRRRLGVAELTYREAVAARHRAGDGARRARRLPRRGRRRARAACSRRRSGCSRSSGRERVRDTPDLRAGDPRRGDGRRDDRPAADRGDHVLRLLRRLLGHRRQRDRQDPLHDRTGRSRCRWSSAPRNGGGLAVRRAALAERRELGDGDPGLKVVAPSTPADVKGLLAAAVRDPDPVHLLRAQRRSTR